MFLGKSLLKICAKVRFQQSCNKSSFNKITLRHGCSHVNLLHIFRTPFPKNTFRRLRLKYPCIFLQPKFRDHSPCSHGVIAFSHIHVILRWWPYQSPTNLSGHNPFQPSVAFQTENGANQMTMIWKKSLFHFLYPQ